MQYFIRYLELFKDFEKLPCFSEIDRFSITISKNTNSYLEI